MPWRSVIIPCRSSVGFEKAVRDRCVQELELDLEH